MDFENTLCQDPFNTTSVPLVLTIPQTEDLSGLIMSTNSNRVDSMPGRMESLYFPALMNQDNRNSSIITQKKFRTLKEKYKISGEIPIRNSSENYNFEILQVIGKGSRGIIYKAVDKISNQEYALKYLEFSSFSDKTYLNSSRELLILQILNQAFEKSLEKSSFLKLTDFYYDDTDNLSGRYYLVIVMEFCILDLHDILIHRKDFSKDFSESELLYILYDMTCALCQLKSLGIAHRDIKLENILYNSEKKKLKLGDFSEAKYYDKLGGQSVFFNTLKGSQAYMSPELLSTYLKFQKQVKMSYDPWKSDIYSLGMCIYVLYKKDRNVLVDRKIIEKELEAWKAKDIKELLFIEQILLSLLENDPEKRISVEDLEITLKDHPDLIKGKNLFDEKNQDIVELALNQQISADETFLISIKKMIGTAEIYQRVFQSEKAIEKYHEIMQYLASFKNLNKCDIEEEKLDKELLFFHAKVYDNLGSIFLKHFQNYAALFNFQEAKNYLKKIGAEAIENEEEYEQLYLRNGLNLAWIYHNNFQYSDSLSMAYEIEEKLKKKLVIVLNEKHDEESYSYSLKRNRLRKIYRYFAELYDSMGVVYRELKYLHKSKEFHKKAIYISEFLDDFEMLQLKSIKGHLAKVLIAMNEYGEAISILQSQIKYNKKNMIYYNDDTSYCLNLLSKIFSRETPLKNLDKAEVLVNESLKILRKIYNGKEEYAHFSFPYIELAKIRNLKNDPKHTEEYLLKANEINCKRLGFEHFNVIYVQKLLAIFYMKYGHHKKAKDIFEDIYGKFKRNAIYIERQRSFYCKVLLSLGELYLKDCDAEKSYIVLNECREILKSNGHEKKELTEKNLILLCENLMVNDSLEGKFKLKQIRKFYQQAEKLNQTSKINENAIRLKDITKFLNRK